MLQPVTGGAVISAETHAEKNAGASERHAMNRNFSSIIGKTHASLRKPTEPELHQSHVVYIAADFNCGCRQWEVSGKFPG